MIFLNADPHRLPTANCTHQATIACVAVALPDSPILGIPPACGPRNPKTVSTPNSQSAAGIGNIDDDPTASAMPPISTRRPASGIPERPVNEKLCPSVEDRFRSKIAGKALHAAAAFTAFAGSAIAQTSAAATTDQGEPQTAQWSSQQEEAMFQEHGALWGGFFTDDTFAELAHEAEFQATWDGLTPEQQDEARAVCEQVQAAGTEYRNVTVEWCDNIGML